MNHARKPTALPWGTHRGAVGFLIALFILTSSVVYAADPPEPVVDPGTEEVIQGAGKWLASRQQPGGYWGDHNKAAYTGYVLISLMAAGNLPDEGPQGAAVAKATQWLLECVRPDGYVIAADEVGNDKGMYGHGIATIALAEVYGQTHDPKVKPKLERAIKLICDTQTPQGGWRYLPIVKDADLSVTVLQVVALRAASNDGLSVPKKTIDKAVEYVKACRDPRGSGGFAYQPGGGPGFARTAAAIYSLQVCGLYKDPLVTSGSEFLTAYKGPEQWFTYGHFYTAPAMYMIGGETWATWYDQTRTKLSARVQRRGDLCYWPQLQGDASGQFDVYVTAVDSMILAMPYHYLPLYQR